MNLPHYPYRGRLQNGSNDLFVKKGVAYHAILYAACLQRKMNRIGQLIKDRGIGD